MKLRCNLPADRGKPIIQVRGEVFPLGEIIGNLRSPVDLRAETAEPSFSVSYPITPQNEKI